MVKALLDDVVPAQEARVVNVVVAVQAQALGEHGDGVDLTLDRGKGVPLAPTGKIVDSPLLGGLAQPLLRDAPEVEEAFAQPEGGAVPGVLVSFGLRRQAEAGEVLEEAECQLFARGLHRAEVDVLDRGDLLSADGIDERAKFLVLLLDALSVAVLQTVEDFRDHLVGQAAQADDAVLDHRRRGPLPEFLVF
jgi:hypothetical protein